MAQGDTGPGPRRDATTPIAIEDEMKRSYLDYAMSVIVSRAIPDARDGLKPVHRRILFGMHEQGHTYDRPYRKSAKIVGDVIGKYHPHGDSAVYDALVRLAQPFSMGLPLVDGQGNFGSVDGDPPAAMRYTECRSSYAASFILADIEKETVDFQDNYDGQEREPTVLPARFPNLLVNGAGGIAVGMATNIPPHNLGEVLDAAVAMVDRPDITDAELLDFVPAPDFPTGGLIIGRAGARSALLTGRGSVTMRARVEIEEGRGGRRSIIVKEIPYQVNKSTMIERIAELVREKRIEGVSEINDHSDRDGMRVVIELKREAAVDVVLNQLYRHSALQISFGVNMLALNGGRPEMLTLRTSLQAFLAFREEVVARRTKFDLRKARERAHVLVALAAAVANIEEIIDTIRKAPDPATARERLMARAWPAGDMGPLIQLVADPRSVLLADGSIRLTDEQARAILALQLSRLTGLGRDEIGSEARALSEKIRDLLDILSSRGRVAEIIKSELLEVRTAFAIPRRSEIVDLDLEIEDEDLIAREDMVVTITRGGYVKRTNLDEYRTQRRGGRGRAGMAMKDEDVITRAFVASTHAPILCFSATGMAYKLKVWRLPQADPRGRGKAFVNLLPLAAEDTIANVMALPEDEAAWAELDVVFVTRSGHVRRNKLSDFAQINRSGKIAMKLEEGDGIVSVQLCSEADDVLLTTEGGRCIRFPVTDVRVFVGRTSTGVRGVALDAGDAVISAAILRHVDLTPAEARAYLRHAAAMRRAVDEDEAAGGEAALQAEDEVGEGDEADGDVVSLSPERLADLGAREEFVLTAANDGYGKRTSAYEYRCAGRGGKGLRAHDLSRGGRLAASFPVEDDDEVMIVTDAGQLIRAAVGEVRIASRATRGVRLIRVEDAECVVSVERIADQGAERAAP